jgi:hypothetical protein
MEGPNPRKSLTIDIWELRIRMYMPLFILVDHYWLRAKAISRGAACLAR